MIDTTQSFHDESGLVVPPKGTSDSLEGPETTLSPSRSDMSPEPNQSRRDSDPKTDPSLKTDQSQQDSSSSPNIVHDTSENVPHDSNAPNQVPAAQSSQDSEDQTKDEGVDEQKRFMLKIKDCSWHLWDRDERLYSCEIADATHCFSH